MINYGNLKNCQVGLHYKWAGRSYALEANVCVCGGGHWQEGRGVFTEDDTKGNCSRELSHNTVSALLCTVKLTLKVVKMLPFVARVFLPQFKEISSD